MNFNPLKMISSIGTKNDRFYSELPVNETLDFNSYLNYVLHQWLKTLTMLGYTLVPFFFILDYFTAPRELVLRFGLYRLLSVAVIVTQYFIIRFTKPNSYSYIHGYFISINVAGIITIMTMHMGGFGSSYYAGLNLVMVAVNLLLPWRPVHSAINAGIIIFMYVLVNALFGENTDIVTAATHLFFMFGTAVISVSINNVKNKLEEKEFYLRGELKKARDALWGEMEIAKRIQTALLPGKAKIGCFTDDGNGCYTIAATMRPADEVGGDYYDIIQTNRGEQWIAIGDVTGHGVESGLIMMMTQTSIYSILDNTSGYNPSVVLNAINHVIKDNISRLGADRYIAVSLMRLDESSMVVAGKHQDILIYRAAQKKVEVVQTEGTWIGIYDKIKKYMVNLTVPIEVGDTILLFTDGITEATDENGDMYGQERLVRTLEEHSGIPVEDILAKIINDVSAFWDKQHDDITAMVLRRER